MHPMPSLTEQDVTFLKTRVTVTSVGCWLWLGARNRQGYGCAKFGGKHYLVHRVFFFMETGAAPGDLCVCHHCDNPSCVNPDHLFLGTVADNNNDKMSKRRNGVPPSPRLIDGKCPRCGHERTDDYVDRRGVRRCRSCVRIRCAATYEHRYGLVKAKIAAARAKALEAAA
jgi:hypothetical protein